MNNIPYNHISVIVLPTDYCNMNCVYCFNGRRSITEKRKMSESTLQKMFEAIIPYYDDIHFVWHGGEPLSMGLSFYEKVIELQSKINTKKALIRNSIQTNLTMLNDEIVDFVIKHNFHIGSSFDGTQNELTRHNSKQIMAGYELLKQKGEHCGFICVVQSRNIDHLIEDYNWFKSKGINYTLNIYLAKQPFEDDPLFVEPNHYVERIKEFFDYWLDDIECNINISYFNMFLNHILMKKKELCCFNSCVGKHIGIQYDGTIYGCNRDFPSEFSFGNINDYEDIHDCFNSSGFNKYLEEAIVRRRSCKETCEIFDFCSGGCNSTALMNGSISKCNEYYCQTLIPIYRYIASKVEKFKNKNEDYLKNKFNPVFVDIVSKYQHG